MKLSCPTKKLIITLSTIALFLAVSAKPTLAQEVSIVVSPPRTDINAEPGEVIQKTIKITNNSETEQVLDIRALIIDYIVQDDIGTPVKVSAESAGRYLASPWISLDRTLLTLQPKQEEIVNAVIQIPSDALPGGHYAGIFFEPTEPGLINQTASQTIPQVGSLFLINIAGDINYAAEITRFNTSSRFYEFGPVDFEAVVENRSDTHIRPITSILIKNMIGKQVAEITPDEVNIFPFTTRTYSTIWDQIWGFGRYEATLKVPYGPSGNVATSTIFFWILPYRLIAAIIVVILLLIGLFVSIKRHMHHRLDTRDDEIDTLKRRIAELENKGK